jgi:CRISPR-associated protein Csd1
MILQSLYELYNRLSQDPDEYNIPPPGYSLQKISFKIVLKPDGTLHAIEDARKQSGKKLAPVPIIVPGYTKSSGSGFNPCFLWDNTGYMLGYKPNDKDPERTLQTFQSFRDKHLELMSEINSPPYHAVCQFLKTWNPEKATDYPIIEEIRTGFGVFQIVGQTSYIHDDPVVKGWYLREKDRKTKNLMGQCLITGRIAPISRLHEPKIKRVGDQAESLLVSFNDPAYESYGKEQSFNAPVSEDAAFRYATALNALLDGPKRYKHRFSLADTTIVFWTKEPTTTEDIFAQFATSGSITIERQEVQDESLRQKIELFLKALRKGKEVYSEIEKAPDTTPFFILGLTGQAKGRIGVKFFYRDTISHLLNNLRQHYADMGIERQYGEDTKYPDPEFPALWQLLDETCSRKNGKPDRDKIPPILSGPLLRAVITGSQYPEGLFSAVMRRIHADRIINYIRACIIKGYLIRNQRKEVGMYLNEDNKDHAYRLGRLFAALEKIQEEGFYQQTGRRLEHSIRDSYFSAACATPGVVFPRLERLSTHHRRLLPLGRKTFFDKLIADIKWEQSPPKSILNLQEQGVFIMGYYHQRKMLFTKKEDQIQPNEEV